MKTGVIVYVVGSENRLEGSDLTEAVKRLNIDAERVEIVSSSSGHFDVMDAWWALTTKGMSRIVCLIAEVSRNARLRLTGRELRLCG